MFTNSAINLKVRGLNLGPKTGYTATDSSGLSSVPLGL